MTKNRILLSVFILILLLVTTGSLKLKTEAAPLRQDGSTSLVEEQVWQEMLAAPNRETTFQVRLSPEGEKSIEAQFRLEKILTLMQKAGSLSDYQSYYGRNIIEITGGAGIVHFLQEWPELARITSSDSDTESVMRTQAFDPENFTGTSQITGSVTANGGLTDLSGIEVTAYLQTGVIDWHAYPSVDTGADGSYTISDLASGTYRVKFVDPSGNYVSEYYDDKYSFELATNFDIEEGETAENINADLALAGSISGTISLDSGGTETGLVASAWSNASGSWRLISNAITNDSGGYSIRGLLPGNYRVMFSDSSLYIPPRFVTEYYDNVLNIEDAQDVPVTAGVPTTGINASLGTYGSVSGNVKASDGTSNLANITVDVYRFDAANTTWNYFASEFTDASGNYEVYGLGTENIRVGFFDQYDQFEPEFYNDKPDLASADNIGVNLGQTTPNINAEMALAPVTIEFDLVAGWNLVSLPVVLDDNSTSSAFASISGNHEDIFSYEANLLQPWKLYNPPIDQIISVDTVRGYWIDMNIADTLSLTGTYPLETTIDLYGGWNLIGYPSASVKPVETVLEGINGLYSLVWQYKAADSADPWKSYNPSVPSSLNDLKNFEPGFGYWIYMTQDAALTVEGR